MRWRVYARPTWTVESPGGHRWTGLPSLQAAYRLAIELIEVEAMLARITVRAAA